MDKIEIRKLPEQEDRVETGPVRFGDDWTGLFIRGDTAFHIAHTLRAVLEHETFEHPVLKNQLEGFAELMESCSEIDTGNDGQ